MRTVGLIAGIILIFSILIGIAVGGWWLKRYVNYHLLYRSYVQEDIQKEIEPLKARIKVLEDKLGRNQ